LCWKKYFHQQAFFFLLDLSSSALGSTPRRTFMTKKLSHLDAEGKAHMVDISQKEKATREATAVGTLHCKGDTIILLRDEKLPKGDVLAVARIAGIQGAKKCADLIPLCHTIPLHKVVVDFQVQANRIKIEATVRTAYQTGVEMEALTAVSVAALTLYDMLKAVDSSMEIDGVQVTSKTKKT